MGLEGLLIETGEGKKVIMGTISSLILIVGVQSDMECSGSSGINNCVSVLIGPFDTVHVENKDKKKKEENEVGKGVGIINGLGLVGQAGQPQNPSIIECDIARDRNSVLSLDEKQGQLENEQSKVAKFEALRKVNAEVQATGDGYNVDDNSIYGEPRLQTISTSNSLKSDSVTSWENDERVKVQCSNETEISASWSLPAYRTQ
ncbi:hypothetical protein QYF36_005122 [Acer negundo]|nr:hypothetical protein QYF36_005122 [Acer negundo]